MFTANVGDSRVILISTEDDDVKKGSPASKEPPKIVAK